MNLVFIYESVKHTRESTNDTVVRKQNNTTSGDRRTHSSHLTSGIFPFLDRAPDSKLNTLHSTLLCSCGSIHGRVHGNGKAVLSPDIFFRGCGHSSTIKYGKNIIQIYFILSIIVDHLIIVINDKPFYCGIGRKNTILFCFIFWWHHIVISNYTILLYWRNCTHLRKDQSNCLRCLIYY